MSTFIRTVSVIIDSSKLEILWYINYKSLHREGLTHTVNVGCWCPDINIGNLFVNMS